MKNASRRTYSIGGIGRPTQLCLSLFRIQQHHCRKGGRKTKTSAFRREHSALEHVRLTTNSPTLRQLVQAVVRASVACDECIKTICGGLKLQLSKYAARQRAALSLPPIGPAEQAGYRTACFCCRSPFQHHTHGEQGKWRAFFQDHGQPTRCLFSFGGSSKDTQQGDVSAKDHLKHLSFVILGVMFGLDWVF